MKNTYLFLLLFLLQNSLWAQKQQFEMAFQVGEKICLIESTTKAKSFLSKGNDACLSPDGLQIAITKSNLRGNRSVSIVDLNTKIETKLLVNSSNYYMADWSADGARLLLNVFDENNWSIGMIDSDNKNYKEYKSKIPNDFYSATWFTDSKRFAAHNLATIYIFNLNCEVLDTINIEKQIGKGLDISSTSRFWFTGDDQYIFFNSGTDEQMDEVEGPVDALFVYNRNNKQLDRITKKGFYATNPFLINAQTILFSGFYEKDKDSNIYNFDLKTKQINLLFKNGMWPTGIKK